jgi:selenide,water dikinase
MPDTSKRARVMRRSKKLGHCICDPRKSCPCDVLLEKDVCLCAGERLDEAGKQARPVALTKLVKNAGCASKIPAADLARVLSRLPIVTDPRVLVGTRTADDAGVFKVSDDLCLVQTVDVFAPCVDDPYQFGKIAACNSLSDIYAMGGTPLTALSIIGYPIHTLSDEGMFQMLKGGMDMLAEAGVALVGGHSINDEEIKFGFSVTGLINPREIITNAGAQPGDALILTKRIGAGIIAFAAQMGRASEESLRAASETMATLNRAAAEVMRKVGAHSCTDVTGFGLLGHLANITRESEVTAEIWWEALPLLPNVAEYAKTGIVSGAAERNREFAAEIVEVGAGVPDYAMDILYDAQTSGGLLFSVAEGTAQKAIDMLRAAGCTEAAIVGRIAAKSKGEIMVTDKRMKDEGGRRNPKATEPKPEICCVSHPTEAIANKKAAEACCETGAPPAEAGAAQKAFQQFLAKAFAPGALDVVQKELMTIALSVAVQCKDCLAIHLQKARSMGLTVAEIEEAAWMGVAFGGCKAMMFWTEHGKE